MHQATKAKVLNITGIVLGCISFAFAVLSFVLIKDGVFPPDGNGSLGHVGMVIAGIIAGFLVLVFGSLSFFFIHRARKLSRDQSTIRAA